MAVVTREESERLCADMRQDPTYWERFVAALREMVVDDSSTPLEKVRLYVDESFPSDEEAEKFLHYIWEVVDGGEFPRAGGQ